MRETSVGNKIVIAERDNIAAVMENGKVSEFFVSLFRQTSDLLNCIALFVVAGQKPLNRLRITPLA